MKVELSDDEIVTLLGLLKSEARDRCVDAVPLMTIIPLLEKLLGALESVASASAVAATLELVEGS